MMKLDRSFFSTCSTVLTVKPQSILAELLKISPAVLLTLAIILGYALQDGYLEQYYRTRMVWFLVAFFGLFVFTNFGASHRIASPVLTKLSAFLARRKAFDSHPSLEASKFAIIRILFGLVLFERCWWTLYFMTPTDWSSAVIVYFEMSNAVLSICILFGFMTQFAFVYAILAQWQIGNVVLGTVSLGDYVSAMLSVVLFISNAGAHFSLDQRLSRPEGPWSLRSLWYYDKGLPSRDALQLAKFTMLAAYWAVCVYSLMMHLADSAWMWGVAGPELLTSNFMSRYPDQISALMENSEIAVRLAKLSIWCMFPWYVGVLPLVIIGGYARRYVIVWGILFFSLSLFVLQLGSLAYIEFLFWLALFWEKSFITGQGRFEIAYDDRCNLCDATVTFIKRVDVFRTIELLPISKSNAWLSRYNVSHDAGMKDLHGVDPSNPGSIYKGYTLYIELTKRMPVLIPVYPILLVGKFTGIGPFIYSWVAVRRTRIFGVCELPRVKAEYPLPGSGAVAEVDLNRNDIVIPMSLHCCVLIVFYLVQVPVPWRGWNGITHPPDVARFVSAVADQASIFGIGPIDVFNAADLKLSENWFTIRSSKNRGPLKLVPLLSENGTRMSMLASDRIYYGRVLPWRRAMVGREDCSFNEHKGMVMEISATFSSRKSDATVEFVYTQYHQDNPNEAAMLANKFVVEKPVVVCQVKFYVCDVDQAMSSSRLSAASESCRRPVIDQSFSAIQGSEQ
jgi:predicted DCC family thiol-disulfide oxidoreductase YuxK